MTNGDSDAPAISLESWSLSESAGGEDISGKIFVSMDASINGSNILYMLDNTGDVYTLQLDANGAPNGTIAKLERNETPAASYTLGSARIRCTDGNDDEIIITGLNRHIVVRRQNQTAGYACCTTSLK
jgi:hypothetical protein